MTMVQNNAIYKRKQLTANNSTVIKGRNFFIKYCNCERLIRVFYISDAIINTDNADDVRNLFSFRPKAGKWQAGKTEYSQLSSSNNKLFTYDVFYPFITLFRQDQE